MYIYVYIYICFHTSFRWFNIPKTNISACCNPNCWMFFCSFQRQHFKLMLSSFPRRCHIKVVFPKKDMFKFSMNIFRQKYPGPFNSKFWLHVHLRSWCIPNVWYRTESCGKYAKEDSIDWGFNRLDLSFDVPAVLLNVWTQLLGLRILFIHPCNYCWWKKSG